MAANVGLSTPRGSGTSGYVQRNLSHFKPREPFSPYARDGDAGTKPIRPRQPDQQILEHDRRREIEVRVFDLRDKLEDEGAEPDEIEKQVEKLRASLSKGSSKAATTGRERPFKLHQVHEQAQAKIVESEKLRRALGIRNDYQDGDHWNREDRNAKEKA